MKISVITPTYNDSSTILETISSLKSQTYTNWEHIIVDDGSTDDTKIVIQQYIDKNNGQDVKYVYQENKDQLNAIINALNYINGDYVFVLHSDDLLPSNDFFEKCIKYIKCEKKLDAIIGNLIIIDENSKVTNTQFIKKYENKKYIFPLQQLWLGRNLFVDVALFEKNFYINQVKNNYLIWNTPFWIDFNKNQPKMANIKNVEFPLLKYRVHSLNYINNEIGKLNVINGELRTLVNLMKYYNLPMYNLQFYMYRIFNKIHLEKYFRPFYKNKEQKNKYKILEFIIKKRFGDSYKENLFLDALVKFYKNKVNRTIKINQVIDENNIFYGKDMRKFNKNLLEDTLNEFYKYLLNEMKKGFNKIEVKSVLEKEKIEKICRFLCIDKEIKILVK